MTQRRGVFKDDLAQVDYVETSQNQVTLKLLPRIDYTRMRGTIRAPNTEKRKKKRRPVQKLFDEDGVRLGHYECEKFNDAILR